MKKTTFNWPIGRSLNLLLIAILSIAVTTTSCKKDDDDDTPTTSTPKQSGPPTPQPADASGTLVAVQSTTIQTVPGLGDIEIPLYTAVAVFYDDPTAQTFLNAGTVSCEGENLTKQSGNQYVFTPSQTSPSGLTFDGDVDWEVSGAGSVPTISESIGMGFPGIGSITSDSIVDKTKDYTLSCTFATNVDSIIWIVGGVYHTTGSSTQHTFTKDELSALSKGQSVAQVAGYRITSADTDGKTYYYVNETVQSKTITIE